MGDSRFESGFGLIDVAERDVTDADGSTPPPRSVRPFGASETRTRVARRMLEPESVPPVARVASPSARVASPHEDPLLRAWCEDPLLSAAMRERVAKGEARGALAIAATLIPTGSRPPGDQPLVQSAAFSPEEQTTNPYTEAPFKRDPNVAWPSDRPGASSPRNASFDREPPSASPLPAPSSPLPSSASLASSASPLPAFAPSSSASPLPAFAPAPSRSVSPLPGFAPSPSPLPAFASPSAATATPPPPAPLPHFHALPLLGADEVDEPFGQLATTVGSAPPQRRAASPLPPSLGESAVESGPQTVRETPELRAPAPYFPPPSPPVTGGAHLTLTERQSVPRVLKSTQEVTKLPIDHRAGFLLAHVDGMQTLEEILDVCAMPTVMALELMERLEQMGVITFD